MPEHLRRCTLLLPSLGFRHFWATIVINLNLKKGNDATMGRGDAENARHEYSGKAEYRKPLVVKYR